MPKDKTENIDRYKVRGGQFNDYKIKQDELAWVQDDQDRTGGGLHQGELPGAHGNNPQDEAARIQQMMEDAREKAARKKAKLLGKSEGAAAGASKKGGGKGAGKSSAKKSTKKAAAGTSKKSAAKKSAAKKSSAKKGASKKSAKGGRV